jgi:tRNA 2-thiouridine synthesizing protein A
MSIYQLDTRRLICPMPVIKLQDKIKELKSGDKIELIGTDKGVLYDVPAWCRVHGHQVEQIEQHGHEIKITVLVK